MTAATGKRPSRASTRGGRLSPLLIANGGDVAERIARAAAAEGMVSAAMAGADESDASHLAAADERHTLLGTASAASLDTVARATAATATCCDLLRPGYGFLSERSELAEAGEDAGRKRWIPLVFLGPSASVLCPSVTRCARRSRHPRAGGRGGRGGRRGVASLLAQTGAVMLKARAGGGGRGTAWSAAATTVAAAMTAPAPKKVVLPLPVTSLRRPWRSGSVPR
ncbi:biotin carboxylase N-terminal domain-containing protein [Blastococcus montanus]|uniref:biotin carboxylase N-terminal domain-containing protein n=1 Tax=Blastococcus montanus TaxID=3144973 RepID=UPI003208754D